MTLRRPGRLLRAPQNTGFPRAPVSEAANWPVVWGDCRLQEATRDQVRPKAKAALPAADPFAEVLRLTQANSVLSGGFSARGNWALRFPALEQIKLLAVVRGTCRLRIEGQKRDTRLEAGDVVFLPGRPGFLLGSNLSFAPRDAGQVREGLVRVGEGRGPECVVISGVVSPHPASATLLSMLLPAQVHVRGSAPEAAQLHAILEQILEERSRQRPGNALASALLAQLLFVQALRAHIAGAGPVGPGWVHALRDERIAPALQLMHGTPSRKWTLEELARASAMSRTSFATHFKAVAGMAPLAYLTAWRMHLAQRALRDRQLSVRQIADSLGYSSESAFSNAFKRETGQAPRHYQRAQAELAGSSPA